MGKEGRDVKHTRTHTQVDTNTQTVLLGATDIQTLAETETRRQRQS
jgi:hypothetical protein